MKELICKERSQAPISPFEEPLIGPVGLSWRPKECVERGGLDRAGGELALEGALAHAPPGAEDLDAVRGVVAHEVEGLVRGEPFRNRGRFPRGDPGVEVAGDHVTDLRRTRVE